MWQISWCISPTCMHVLALARSNVMTMPYLGPNFVGPLRSRSRMHDVADGSAPIGVRSTAAQRKALLRYIFGGFIKALVHHDHDHDLDHDHDHDPDPDPDRDN